MQRVFASLQRVVADLAECGDARWFDTGPINGGTPEGPIARRTALVGFDQRDTDGRLVGRFEGHIHLYRDVTPEQYADMIREQLG